MMLLRVRRGRMAPRPSWGGCQLSQAALPLVCAYTHLSICMYVCMYYIIYVFRVDTAWSRRAHT